MPKYKVKSAIQYGKTLEGSKTYKPGDTIELSEAEAMAIGHALEGAPVDPAIPDSTRLRPDGRDSGVAAVHKIDATPEQILGSNAQALQNVLDSETAEHSDAPLAADLEKKSKENVERAARPAAAPKPVTPPTPPPAS